MDDVVSSQPAPKGPASRADYDAWWHGEKDLTYYCVCRRYPKSCHFHTVGTITEGPHNLPAAVVTLNE